MRRLLICQGLHLQLGHIGRRQFLSEKLEPMQRLAFA
jgi:hypothetical protein